MQYMKNGVYHVFRIWTLESQSHLQFLITTVQQNGHNL